jgi:hypothetical protein
MVPGSGQALSLYDDWSSGTIRRDHWRGSDTGDPQEVLREVVSAPFGQYLTMRLRREGDTDTSTGNGTAVNFLNAADPASIGHIEALMGVLNVAVDSCGANASEAAFQLALTSFNDGSGSAGNRTGDYNAYVEAYQNSATSSADVLSLRGRVTRCRDAACSVEDPKGAASLGTVGVGVAFTLQLTWDPTHHQFTAGVNSASPAALAYSASDSRSAARPFAGIQLQSTAANCRTGAVSADIEAGVGPVQTAAPVLPPPVTTPPTVTPPSTPPTFLGIPITPVSTPQPPTPPPPPTTPPPTTEDNSPFQFPPQPPPTDDASARYTTIGSDPNTGSPFYIALPGYTNPLPGSYLFAGFVPDGRRLWVPAAAQPAAIRRALATGHL